jgi:hypothetical protein
MSVPPKSKTYYENHKDEIINKSKEYEILLEKIKNILKPI